MQLKILRNIADVPIYVTNIIHHGYLLQAIKLF